MPTKRIALPLVALAVALPVSLSLSPAAGETRRSADEEIAVRDNFFSPRSLTIENRAVVRWVWRGENRHNVTFTRIPEGAGKRNARLRRSGDWFRKFRRPGRYRYVCTLFAGMRGSITVQEEAQSDQVRNREAGVQP